ncbi:MAG: hypothetical protein QW212_06140, partial [Nitrososphaerales archaeon]
LSENFTTGVHEHTAVEQAKLRLAKHTDILPSPISDALAVSWQNRIYIFADSNVSVFEPETNEIFTVPVNFSLPSGAAGVLVGDKYYILGGCYGDYYSNAIFVFNFTTFEISRLNVSLPDAFANGGAALFENAIYILTGVSFNHTYPNKLYRFDYNAETIEVMAYPDKFYRRNPTTDQWEEIPNPDLLKNYSHFGMLTWENEILVFGGIANGTPLHAVFKLGISPVRSFGWLKAEIPADAINSGYAITNAGIYIIGGRNSSKIFTYTERVIYEVPGRLPDEIEGSACAAVNSTVYIVGGRSQGEEKNQVLKFYWEQQPGNFTWSEDFEHGLAGYTLITEGNNYAEISEFAYRGNHSLHLYDLDRPGYCWIETPDLHHTFLGRYRLRFALYLPSTDVHWPWVIVDGGIGFALDYNALWLVDSHGGHPYHRVCYLSAEHWYVIEAYMDTINDTMVVYIDGTMYGPFAMRHCWNAECHFWIGEDWLHKEANWAEFYIDELKVEEITTAVPVIEYVEHYYKAGEYTAKLSEAETEILAINLSWEGSGKVYVSEDNVSWEEVENGIEKSVEWKAVYCKVGLTTPAVNTTPELWNLKANLKSGGTLRVWENNTTAEIYTQEGKPLYGLARGYFAGKELIGIRNYDGWIYFAEKNNTTWNVSKAKATNGRWKMGFDFVVWEGKQYYFWADNGSGNYQVYGMVGNTTALLSTSNTDAIDVHAIAPGTEQLPFRMPKTKKKLHVVWRDYDDWYSMLWYASFDAELTQTGASQRLKLDTNYTELVMDRQGHPLLGLFEPAIATGYFGEVYIAFSRYGIERGIGMATNYEEPDKVVETMQTTIDSLPDEVFDRNPEERKQALNNKLEAIENMLEENNTKGAVQKMKTDVMPKVSGGEGSWIQGSDAAMEVTAMGEQFTTGVSDTSGYSVWLYHTFLSPTQVKLEWGMNFEANKIMLYLSPDGNWVEVTGTTSKTITITANTQYTAQVKARWEAQWFYSTPVSFLSQFAVKGCSFNALPDGKAEVYATANMPLYGIQECYYRAYGGGYTSVTTYVYGTSYWATFTLTGLQNNVNYEYYVVLRGTGCVAQSNTYRVVYNSPAITGVTWTPYHDTTSDYECAKIVWTTNVAASGSKVTIANKVVTATTSSDGKTHTAWVINLKPSCTYSFTVSSVCSGGTLTKSGVGKTRLRMSCISANDEYSMDTGRTEFKVRWKTSGIPDTDTNSLAYSYDGQTWSYSVQNTPYLQSGSWFYYVATVPWRSNNQYIKYKIEASVHDEYGTYTETYPPSGSSGVLSYRDSDCDGLCDVEEKVRVYNTTYSSSDHPWIPDYQPSNPCAIAKIQVNSNGPSYKGWVKDALFKIRVVHTYPSDLVLYLYYFHSTGSGFKIIYNRTYSSLKYIELTINFSQLGWSLDLFQKANLYFQLLALDEVGGDVGYIDYFMVSVIGGTRDSSFNTDGDFWSDGEEAKMGFCPVRFNILSWAVAVHPDDINLGSGTPSSYALDRIVDLGASFVRIDFAWDWLEPSEGQWNTVAINAYKNLINSCKQRGLGVVAVIGTGIPSWARTKYIRPGFVFTPENFWPVWKNFCKRIAEHFG